MYFFQTSFVVPAASVVSVVTAAVAAGAAAEYRSNTKWSK